MKTYLKRAVVIMFVCILPLLVVQAARQEAGGRADLVFAYPYKVLADVDPKDATAAMKIYVDELAKQTGYHAESIIYDSIEEIVEKVKKGMVDFVIFPSMDYLRIKNRVDVSLSLGQVRGGKVSVKYLLLTRANTGYTQLKDLKDKKMLISNGDDIAAMYMSTLLLKNRLGEAKNFFSSVEEKTKASQVVLSVFFGQADACVTTDVTLKTMIELNPQLEKILKVMSSSQELVTSVAVFRRSVSADIQKKTIDIGVKLQDNLRGRQILLLFKIDGLVPLKESDLIGIKDLVSEYDRLRAGKR